MCQSEREREKERVPCDKFLVYISVQDEVKVALSESRLLVLESKVKVRQHVEAGSQQGHRLRNHTQLSLLRLS